MSITLEQIKTLEAIVEAGSFSAAAKQLNKVQSAVSNDIRQMERALDVAIFDRKGYRAVLTAIGEAILREGKLLLARAEHLENMTRHFHEGWEPHLYIVIDGILPMDPIMDVLKTLTAEQIPTHIQIKVEFLGGVQHRSHKEDADLMLVKEYRADTTLKAIPLPEVLCRLVVSPEHALLKDVGPEGLGRQDLQQHIQLAIHDSSESGETEVRYQFGGARTYYLSDFYTKQRALVMGLGYGWMPEYLIRENLDKGELVEVPFAGDRSFRFTPHLVHRANKPPGRTAEKFLAMISKAVW